MRVKLINWEEFTSNNKISLTTLRKNCKNQFTLFVKNSKRTFTSFNHWIPKTTPFNSWVKHASNWECKSPQWKILFRKVERQRRNSNLKKINSISTKRNSKKLNPKLNSSNTISNLTTTIHFTISHRTILIFIITKMSLIIHKHKPSALNLRKLKKSIIFSNRKMIDSKFNSTPLNKSILTTKSKLKNSSKKTHNSTKKYAQWKKTHKKPFNNSWTMKVSKALVSRYQESFQQW